MGFHKSSSRTSRSKDRERGKRSEDSRENESHHRSHHHRASDDHHSHHAHRYDKVEKNESKRKDHARKYRDVEDERSRRHDNLKRRHHSDEEDEKRTSQPKSPTSERPKAKIKKEPGTGDPSKDLSGMKVGHSEKYLREGHQYIMTLADKDVLDESEDVLENVNLAEMEKAEKNIARKLKKDTYRPYEEPEDEIDAFRKKSILSKYDEEIDGPSASFFRIGESQAPAEKVSLEKLQGAVSLDLPRLEVASEYYTEEEMRKFKKPKKVRVGKRGEKVVENLSSGTSGIDHGSRRQRERHSEEPSQEREKLEVKLGKISSILSDSGPEESDIEPPNEDLTAVILEEEEAEEEFRRALEKAKKLKQKEKEKEKGDEEERIRKLIEEREALMKKEEEEEPSTSSKSNTLVLNATAEFCRNLGDISTIKVEEEEEDEAMDFERELNHERTRESDDDKESADSRGKWNEVDLDAEKTTEEPHIVDPQQPILEEEPDVSVGVAAALKVAMKKGYLDKEDRKGKSGSRQTSLLQAQNYTIEEKFYEDDKLGRRERYNGPVTELREKMDYKPDVKLEYVDEKGRVLTPKEAFRVLSHKFHGKGPGKNKIDKRMKKLEQEMKLRQMNSTDTPLGTLKLLQEKQRELHTPYVVLSGASVSLTKK